MKLKFSVGDILTVKEGCKVNVNKFLTTWVSVGNSKDHTVGYITSKDFCLICKVWADDVVGPWAYECIFNEGRGFIFVIEKNEDYLVKVN